MENNREYTPLKPFVQHVEYENGEQVPYRRVWDATNYLLHHEAQFSLGGNGLSRSEIRLDPTPMTLSEMYFPDSLVDHFVTKTNSYARSWLPPSQLEPVTRAEMLRFIAFYYYMGLVRLPNRRDYWRQDDLWPLHQPLTTPTKQRTSESRFHTSQGPRNGVKSAWITSVISTFNPTTLLKTHSNDKDSRMDVIIMYSCSFPLNGVMVVLVFARFFLRIYRLLYRR